MLPRSRGKQGHGAYSQGGLPTSSAEGALLSNCKPSLPSYNLDDDSHAHSFGLAVCQGLSLSLYQEGQIPLTLRAQALSAEKAAALQGEHQEKVG